MKETIIIALMLIMCSCAAISELQRNLAPKESVATESTPKSTDIPGDIYFNGSHSRWSVKLEKTSPKDSFYLKAKVWLSKFRPADQQSYSIDDPKNAVLAVKIDNMKCDSPKGYLGEWNTSFLLLIQYDSGQPKMTLDEISHTHPNPNNIFVGAPFPRGKDDLERLIMSCLQYIPKSFESELDKRI